MELIINVFSLVGSLALFLFGMKTMSEGLEKFAGDRLRSILAAMTKNRVMGVLTGILITALILECHDGNGGEFCECRTDDAGTVYRCHHGREYRHNGDSVDYLCRRLQGEHRGFRYSFVGHRNAINL